MFFAYYQLFDGRKEHIYLKNSTKTQLETEILYFYYDVIG